MENTMSEVRKNNDEIFCPSCGEIVKKEAVICVKCGVQLRILQTKEQTKEPKSKTVAVLLAVFLGLWTWVYTYEEDAWKFWINLVLSIVTAGIWGVIAWVLAIIDVSLRDNSFYNEERS